ncbi:MAG TPA: SRPBCC family protein [Candidatus Elarobacter sp.]|nr:SRPBCC family protein [Dongiaceae bacterium]HZW53664.1 SRPBCC family protein [Candidatus Elarobacter sp.]
MAEHSASVTVNAPLHQVYQLYTHFNDYPKFMTFVKEVTYLDDQRSHWVVDVAGTHAWDAVNEDWVPDRHIGWRSVDGLKNSGRVTFEPVGADRTRLTVEVTYEPPAGLLGAIGEVLGAGGQFERRLQHDLEHFAAMVEQAPPGALDPTSSAYLFHGESAAAQGKTTLAQDESMGMSEDADRATMVGDAGARGDSTPATPVASTTSATTGLGGAAIGAGGVDPVILDPTVPRIPGAPAGSED